MKKMKEQQRTAKKKPWRYDLVEESHWSFIDLSDLAKKQSRKRRHHGTGSENKDKPEKGAKR